MQHMVLAVAAPLGTRRTHTAASTRRIHDPHQALPPLWLLMDLWTGQLSEPRLTFVMTHTSSAYSGCSSHMLMSRLILSRK